MLQSMDDGEISVSAYDTAWVALVEDISGISFLKENIHKLEDENEEHMTIGFEVALPTLMKIAKRLGFDIPNDFPRLQRIYARRDLKLTSREVLDRSLSIQYAI
ncbi:UNVERIFIED_CONTAM: (-)-kolavenyl diphosphate synthase TPS14, chloroplastic [Sesamum latifolium]|uniref:(-)-kolavenyl diphosphate synthase TPS14, chloroplastic n=1 Tax=Sesamum latifolium TaxID=2727402 RepID=A0AAW2Y0D0_9LAMI